MGLSSWENICSEIYGAKGKYGPPINVFTQNAAPSLTHTINTPDGEFIQLAENQISPTTVQLNHSDGDYVNASTDGENIRIRQIKH